MNRGASEDFSRFLFTRTYGDYTVGRQIKGHIADRKNLFFGLQGLLHKKEGW